MVVDSISTQVNRLFLYSRTGYKIKHISECGIAARLARKPSVYTLHLTDNFETLRVEWQKSNSGATYAYNVEPFKSLGTL